MNETCNVEQEASPRRSPSRDSSRGCQRRAKHSRKLRVCNILWRKRLLRRWRHETVARLAWVESCYSPPIRSSIVIRRNTGDFWRTKLWIGSHKRMAFWASTARTANEMRISNHSQQVRTLHFTFLFWFSVPVSSWSQLDACVRRWRRQTSLAVDWTTPIMWRQAEGKHRIQSRMLQRSKKINTWLYMYETAIRQP